ncbi:LOB domain-containing protein 4 [Pyrus ussuriensis x Pyrus communis]|uniref:LOB domain-containing protein 4 n=1 Tax=Pyrus ussuriensis x Pyrus communis TaxID=2448454 RepID=A0A5N5FHE6_9ROSA|nr:LOB domain-containing protein 4 [Pyrus x bretschneideri]KAB2600622.1 LOB domain-containing protein 4 [Pyrus ussuriensis x Pyrus communis]
MEGQSGRKQGSTSPCAACKLLRRRCAQDCVFAPYFPADQPQKFASVHKVFGASNVNKMLQELPEHQRSDAVSSMVYEANARVRDPVYGCVGAISSLQQQIDALQTQLAIAKAEVVHMRMGQFPTTTTIASTTACSPDQKMAPDNPHHHHYHRSHQTATTKSFFSMDMAADQANMGESLWSC